MNRLDFTDAGTSRTDEIDILKWLQLLWRRRFLVAGITVLVCLGSVYYALTAAPTYRSETKIILPMDNRGAGIGGMLSNLGGLGSLLGAGVSGQSASFYASIITSRRMAEHLISRFKLRDFFKYDNDPEGIEATIQNTIGAIFVDTKEPGFLSLAVTIGRPELARDMGYEIVLLTNDLINTLNIDKARERRLFLETRLKDLDVEYNRKLTDLREFFKQNGIIDLSSQASSTVNAAAGLLTEIQSTELLIRVKEKNIGAEHPEILAEKEKLKSKRALYQIITSAETPSDMLKMTPLLPIRLLPAFKLQFQEVSKELEVITEVIKTLQEQYELSRIEEKKEDLYLRILDDPTLPVHKHTPKRKLIVILSTAIGFVFSIFLVLLIEGAAVLRRFVVPGPQTDLS